MTGPERLRDAARFYIRASRATADQQVTQLCAECAFECAQMAEAVERAKRYQTSDAVLSS